MENTNVYIMVPQYSGVDGAIESAYDLAVAVNPDGPIKFHLVDYPEEDPQGKLTFDKDWTGEKEPDPILIKQKDSDDNVRYQIDFDYEGIRKFLEVPEELVKRMNAASEWLFQHESAHRDNSLVVLLNPYGNTNNVFCGPSPTNRNAAFIQTTHYATEVLTARYIPIAYEFFAAVLRFRAFNVSNYAQRFWHSQDLGCVNDFNRAISNIRFKVLSADICDTCYAHMEEQRISPKFLEHIRAGLELVAAEQNNFKRAQRRRKPIEMRMSYRYLIFEGIKARVMLSPKEMTLYKFLMNQHKGVKYHDLGDHRKELIKIYREHFAGELDEMETTIHAVVDRWCGPDSDISQTVSKINKKIKDEIGEELAEPFQIAGGRGEAKRIPSAKTQKRFWPF